MVLKKGQLSGYVFLVKFIIQYVMIYEKMVGFVVEEYIK